MQRHSPLPFWCFDGITDTPLCHVCHSICSQTLTRHTEEAHRVSGVQAWPMLAARISQHANLNSMIRQYWIHRLFLRCKVSTSVTHDPRKSQATPAGCLILSQGQHKAEGLFRWGGEAQSRTIWSLLQFFFKDLLSSANKWTWFSFYWTIWQIFKWHKKASNRLDGKVSEDSPVQMVWQSCLLYRYVCNTEQRRKRHETLTRRLYKLLCFRAATNNYFHYRLICRLFSSLIN